jgi:hypothetical protein
MNAFTHKTPKARQPYLQIAPSTPIPRGTFPTSIPFPFSTAPLRPCLTHLDLSPLLIVSRLHRNSSLCWCVICDYTTACHCHAPRSTPFHDRDLPVTLPSLRTATGPHLPPSQAFLLLTTSYRPFPHRSEAVHQGSIRLQRHNMDIP